MKNYIKPIVIADDVLAESIYMASGDGDCWSITVHKDQDDAGGYATFRVQANHANNLQHLSKATTIVLQFNQPVVNAIYEGFIVTVSGNTVTGCRESLADSYLSGDNFNSLFKVWTSGDCKALQCTGATISCSKSVNVQGNGADGN